MVGGSPSLSVAQILDGSDATRAEKRIRQGKSRSGCQHRYMVVNQWRSVGVGTQLVFVIGGSTRRDMRL